MRLVEELKTFGAMKIMCNIRGVSLSVRRKLVVWKSGVNNGDIRSANLGYEDGWETQVDCYWNQVFTEYVWSDHDWYMDELGSEVKHRVGDRVNRKVLMLFGRVERMSED